MTTAAIRTAAVSAETVTATGEDSAATAATGAGTALETEGGTEEGTDMVTGEGTEAGTDMETVAGIDMETEEGTEAMTGTGGIDQGPQVRRIDNDATLSIFYKRHREILTSCVS